MGEMIDNVELKKPNPHNFNKAKSEIQIFTVNTKTDCKLRTVQINGGLFGKFNHKVTGSELNDLTYDIQKYLKNINDINIKTVNAFSEVYNALDSLDKDYIKSIEASFKALQIANEKIVKAQKDISTAVETQQKTLIILKKFKEKIDNFEHLSDVDILWDNLHDSEYEIARISDTLLQYQIILNDHAQNIDKINAFKEQVGKIKHLQNVDELWTESQSLKQEIKNAEKEISKIFRKLDNQLNLINDLLKFKSLLESYKHLSDIDELWDNSQEIKLKIKNAEKNIEKNTEQIENHTGLINDLLDYKSSLQTYEHLHDIDVLWDNSNTYREEINTIVVDCTSMKEDIGESNDNIKSQKEQIDELRVSFEDFQSQSNEAKLKLKQKLKIAYILGGSSLSVAIVELILTLTGIM